MSFKENLLSVINSHFNDEDTYDMNDIVIHNSDLVIKNNCLEYLLFDFEKEISPGEYTRIFKAVKLIKLVRIPKKDLTLASFLEMQGGVLTGFYQNQINYIQILANICKPVKQGLIFAYGVQGVSDTSIEDAKHQADIMMNALQKGITGTFRTMEYANLTASDARWIFQKLSEMKYMNVIRGIPQPKLKQGRATTQSFTQNDNNNTEEQSEEFLLGMDEHEYIMVLQATTISPETISKWREAYLKEQTHWASLQKGTKSHNFGVSIPMVYGANLGASQGWGTNQGRSFGENYSTSTSHSVGTSESWSESISHSVGTGHSWGNNQSLSAGSNFGESVNSGTSTGVSTNHSDGVSNSLSQSSSFGTNNSIGHSSSVSESTSTGENWGQSQGSSIGTTESTSHSLGQTSGTSVGGSHSTTTGSSYGVNQSTTHGTSSSTSSSNGWSAGGGQTLGGGNSNSSSNNTGGTLNGSIFGFGASGNHSEGQTSGTSESWSNSTNWTESGGTGVSHGTTDSTSVGTSESISKSEGFGTNWSASQGSSETYGTSSGTSKSINEGTSHGTSISNSTGTSTGTTSSQGTNSSRGTSLSTGLTSSDGYGTSVGNSSSYGQSKGGSLGSSLGNSEGWSTSESWGTSQGHSTGVNESWGTGTSQGVSSGRSVGTSTSGSVSQGLSGSMGLGPSLSFGKTFSWEDREVTNLIDMLQFSLQRIILGSNNLGMWFTDCYIVTESEEASAASSTLAMSSWHSGNTMTSPLQCYKPSPLEREYLTKHLSVFSPSVKKEGIPGQFESYKYSTILLSSELAAMSHPPRANVGGIQAAVDDPPTLTISNKRQNGDIFLGYIGDVEKFSLKTAQNNGGIGYKSGFKYTLRSDEIHHAYISGASRSGKTVVARRLVAETYNNVRRGEHKKRMRFLIMDPKQDWRALAKVIPAEHFRFYSLADPNFHPIKMNLMKIPQGVYTERYEDKLREIFIRSYGLGDRGFQIFGQAIHEVYRNAGCYDGDVKFNKKDPITGTCPATERSKNCTLQDVCKKLEEYLEVARNEKKDAIQRILDRMNDFNQPDSVSFSIFCNRGDSGMSIDDLLGADDVIVLESFGMNTMVSSFIFGLITTSVYQYAVANKGFVKPKDQYETVIVIEEANQVLIGNDEDNLKGANPFENILDQSAGYGLFIWTLTQKISDMPSSVLANSAIKIIGRQDRKEDIETSIVQIGKDGLISDLVWKNWLPDQPTGWFLIKSTRNRNFTDNAPMHLLVEYMDIEPPADSELDAILQTTEIKKVQQQILSQEG